MTKVNRKEVIELFADLGWEKAGDWDDAKIKSRAAQIPAKVKEADVAPKNVDIFKRLCAANGELDLGEDGGKAERKPAVRTAAKDEKPSSPAKAGEKVEKKAPKPPTAKIERDAFGSGLGTLAAKVNEVMTTEWKTDTDIQAEADLPMVQTRDRLYFGVTKGQFEYRKLIQFRINPKYVPSPRQPAGKKAVEKPVAKAEKKAEAPVEKKPAKRKR